MHWTSAIVMSIAMGLLWQAQPLHAADAPVEPVKTERVRIVETDQIISNNLTVVKGERLVIRPGVSLRFKPGIGIISGNYIVGNSVGGDGGGVGGAGNSVLTLSGNWIDGNKDKSGTGRGLFVHQGEVRSGMKDSSKIVEQSVGTREAVVGALKKEGVADLPELIPLF